MIFEELFKLCAVLFESVADKLGEERGQSRVGLTQPAAVCNSVCNIDETGLVDVVVIAENAVHEDLRMQLGHTVYHVTARQAEVCHAHFAVCYDCHVVNLCVIAGIYFVQPEQQTAVNLGNNLINSRQLFAEHTLRPSLERLAHDSVVGV